MKKISIILISIILGVSFIVSIIISKQIFLEYNNKKKLNKELSYIKSLNKKIDTRNNIYYLRDEIVTLEEKSKYLDDQIRKESNEIDKYQSSNTDLKDKIKFFQWKV